jgi:hypothetical protein
VRVPRATHASAAGYRQSGRRTVDQAPPHLRYSAKERRRRHAGRSCRLSERSHDSPSRRRSYRISDSRLRPIFSERLRTVWMLSEIGCSEDFSRCDEGRGGERSTRSVATPPSVREHASRSKTVATPRGSRGGLVPRQSSDRAPNGSAPRPPLVLGVPHFVDQKVHLPSGLARFTRASYFTRKKIGRERRDRLTGRSLGRIFAYWRRSWKRTVLLLSGLRSPRL